MKRLVMLSVWLLALVWAANASDIYNNLGSSTSGSDAVSTLGPLADSFSTGPGNFQLNMVGVLLNGDPTIRGTVSIDLLSNRRTPLSPNAPGSFLLQLGTVSDASLSSSSADFFFSAAYPLAPNTRYWIQVSGHQCLQPDQQCELGLVTRPDGFGSGRGILGQPEWRCL